MAERSRGRVKWFNAAKGFGFIEREGQSDVYVHFSEIMGGGYRELHEGETVEFIVADTPKGPQATQVQRLGHM
ncbi:MAG: cold shock domain-containing protein [bacterium]|jgi:CspA family cold shock protein